MASNSKLLTFEEVAKHNHKKDCWIIIHGKVYDVTPFLDDHPGGDEVLVLVAEKDATDDFEEVGHSDSAKEMMGNYYVGDVDVSTLPAKPVYGSSQPTQAPAAVSNESAGFVLKILQFVLPLLMLGLAFALQYYGKKGKSDQS